MTDDTHKTAIITSVITVIGGIIVAVVTGLFTLSSKPSEKNSSNTSNRALNPQIGSQTSPSNTNTHQNGTNQSGGNSSVTRQMYEAVGIVGEEKSYVDPETGFVFAVDEITTGILGRTRGVFSRYNLPDGTYEGPLPMESRL